MQILQLPLPEAQYERLQHTAQARRTSVTDLALEAVEALLRSEAMKSRYTRLASKQAAWWALDVNLRTRMDDLRLDLIYHSEALEGSPLTKSQIEQAIEELSPR